MEAPTPLVKTSKHQLLLFIIIIILLWGMNTLDFEYKSKWSDLIFSMFIRDILLRVDCRKKGKSRKLERSLLEWYSDS